EHEVNGDMVYLHERVASLVEPVEESVLLSTLRSMKAIAFDLNGYWLYYGFARTLADRAAACEDDNEKLALLRLSERVYRVCTASDELTVEAWFGLGLVQLAQENLNGARETLAFALELSGSSVDAELYFAYGEVLERLNQNDAALSVYQKGREAYPKDIRFVYNQGRVHFVLGNNDKAIEYFEATLQAVDPSSEFAKELQKTLERLKNE
ncbi:MAG: tetratricopeptide repeat protein, partial [Planctomycetes bacterium]|nr:tetratricopeptide repeat protein [Planctomycetota bacterium]